MSKSLKPIKITATERSIGLVGALGAGIRAAATRGTGAHGPKGRRHERRANRQEARNVRYDFA